MFGNGTKFKRLDSELATPAMVDIGQAIVELGGFSLSRETKSGNKYSDGTSWKKLESGMRSAGETTIKVEFDRAEGYHASLLADFNSDDAGRYGFDWPDAAKTAVECDGLVTGFEVTHETEDKLYANVTIAWSGEPAWGNWS